MIPSGFLQDLLSRVDIVEVVGRHVELKRGGANWMGLCPFHAERSPSFSVSPSKQFYYCFGCGAGGDAIRFLTEHRGVSFVEAVQELAQQAGLQVPQEDVSPEERVRRQKLSERRLSLTEVLQRAADFYREQLPASPAVDYLKRRGLTGQVAKRFGLGWAPPGWRTLAGVFPRYDDPLLEEAGLVRAQVDESTADSRREASHDAAGTALPVDREERREERREDKRYDWFRARVMFPIRSLQGEVIGFGGRVLDDSRPKYMNSPETPVFSKGRELYGLFEARQALREKGYALVVEGYMDVVALAQMGFANAVATLGTACTAEHVQKLFRFTDAVVFSFDGDAAGRRAAARALEAALPHATELRSIRFLFLPPEHDPDSFVRERGAAAFEEMVEKAVPLSVQLLEQARDNADLGHAEGRAAMLARARPLWATMPEGLLKRQLLGELARRAQLPEPELLRLWDADGDAQAASAAPAEGRHEPASPAARRPSFTPHRTRTLPGRRPPAAPADLALRLLLRRSAWWEELGPADQQLLHELGGEHGAIVQWLEGDLLDHGPRPWSALDEALRDSDLHAAAARLADPTSLDDEASLEEFRKVIHRLWLKHLEPVSVLLAAEAQRDAGAMPRYREVLAAIKEHRLASN